MLRRRTSQDGARRLPKRSPAALARDRERARLSDALGELQDLLEQYAPPWYTRANQRKAQSARRRRSAELAVVVLELYDLLESYAPAWYTEEQHERAGSALQLLKKS